MKVTKTLSFFFFFFYVMKLNAVKKEINLSNKAKVFKALSSNLVQK